MRNSSKRITAAASLAEGGRGVLAASTAQLGAGWGLAAMAFTEPAMAVKKARRRERWRTRADNRMRRPLRAEDRGPWREAEIDCENFTSALGGSRGDCEI